MIFRSLSQSLCDAVYTGHANPRSGNDPSFPLIQRRTASASCEVAVNASIGLHIVVL